MQTGKDNTRSGTGKKKQLWRWRINANSVSNSESVRRRQLQDKALVIDGKTLVYILDKRARLQEKFLKLATKCSSVLCCRTTPLQKAYIVRIIKVNIIIYIFYRV